MHQAQQFGNNKIFLQEMQKERIKTNKVFQIYSLINICSLTQLLFISYKFVKGFGRLLIYYLLFQTETFMVCVNDFYITRNKISA